MRSHSLTMLALVGLMHAESEVPELKPGMLADQPDDQGGGLKIDTGRGAQSDTLGQAPGPKLAEGTVSTPKMTPAQAKKRPPQTIGAVARVLADAGLEEYLDVRQVPQTQNLSVQPLLAQGVQTPWTQLSDWDRVQVLVKAVQALDNAGFGFPEEPDPEDTSKVLPAESVGQAFRLANRQSRVLQPRIFVNKSRFDRESAQAAATMRKALAEGSPETRKLVKNVAAQIREEAAADSDIEPVGGDTSI